MLIVLHVILELTFAATVKEPPSSKGHANLIVEVIYVQFLTYSNPNSLVMQLCVCACKEGMVVYLYIHSSL